MSASQSHVIIVNNRGSFCHGVVRILLSQANFPQRLQARNKVTKSADQTLFDWGCHLLQQFLVVTGRDEQDPKINQILVDMYKHGKIGL